jgi:hypothetical protein
MEETMRTIVGRLAATLWALFPMSDLAAAQSKITIAVGGRRLPVLSADRAGKAAW